MLELYFLDMLSWEIGISFAKLNAILKKHAIKLYQANF